jgi:hypothetical protein
MKMKKSLGVCSADLDHAAGAIGVVRLEPGQARVRVEALEHADGDAAVQ